MTSLGFSKALGLVLAVLGIAYAVGAFSSSAGAEALTSGPFRALMLAIALALCFLGVLGADARGRRHAMIERTIAGIGLTAGLLALWLFSAGPDTPSTHVTLRPWTALLGCAAILVATWRMRNPWLAIAGVLAIAHAATWRHGFDPSAVTAIDVVREIGETLWFGLEDGALGWVLDALSSTVLPFFFLGGMLAGHTFISRLEDGRSRSGRLIAAIRATCRFLVPPLAIGFLLMTERPGIVPLTILPVWILSIGVGAIWFWFMPSNSMRDGRSPGPAWQNLLLIGGAMTALALALASGVSLQGAAIIALAVTLALSAIDPEVRRRPTITLGTLAETGVAFGRLLVLAGAVGMVLAALERSGLPLDIARLLAGGLGEAWLPLSLFAAIVAAGFGMIMPGIAAYLITIALLAPALRTVGLDTPSIHLLVLLVSAGASAIVAAQAASDVKAGGPIGTALSGNAASR